MTRKKLLCLFLLFFGGLGFAQVQEIYDYELTPAVVGVRADNGPKRMYAEVITIDIFHEGYYQIIPKILYNSGDEQKNESFYLTVRDQFDTVHTPVDSNAGPYKVIEDDPGPPHTAWRLGGRFYLYPGPNTIEMHHYAKIMDEYPQFMNGPIGGPESIRLVDSLRVIAEPLVDGSVQVRSTPPRYRRVDGEQRGLVYPDEAVPYRITVTNMSHNLLRYASLKNKFPDIVTPGNFSVKPDSVIDSMGYWQLPIIEPLDSVVITFDGKVESAAPGFTPLIDRAVLVVANDSDTTNNVDSDTLYVFADDQGTRPDSADVFIHLESITDSISVADGDTLKWSWPDSVYTYDIEVVNNGPDYSDSLLLVHTPPEHISISGFDIAPDSSRLDSLYWNLEPLAPGDAFVIQYDAHVQTPPVLTQSDSLLLAFAEVRSNRDPVPANNAASDTVYIDLSNLPSEPKLTDLRIMHTALSDSMVQHDGALLPAVQPDQEFVLEITAQNTGENSAQDVKIRQILPEYMSILGTSRPATLSGDTLSWDLGTVLPGQERYLTVNAIVSSEVPETVVDLQSEAILSALNDSDPSNNRDTARVVVLESSVLEETDVFVTYSAISDTQITVSGMNQAAAFPGSPVDYTLFADNKGPDIATDVLVSVALPAEAIISQFAVTPDRQTADSVFWHLDAIVPNNPVDLSFQIQTKNSYPFYPYLLQSTAEIFDDQDIYAPDNKQQTSVYVLFPPVQQDLSVELFSVTDSTLNIQGVPMSGALPGEEFFYELVLKNQSTEKAENVRVSLYLPGYVGFRGSNFTPATTSQDSVVWILDQLNAGQSITIRADANLTDKVPSLIIDRTSVARIFAVNDPNPNNNVDSDTIMILRNGGSNAPGDLEVQFVAIADSQIAIGGKSYPAVLPHEQIEYQLRVVNHGPGTAFNLVLENIIPDSIEVTDFALPPTIQRQDTLFWEFDSLVSGASLQLDYSGITADDFPLYPYLLPNSVKLVSQNDPDLSNNQDNAPSYVLYDEGAGSDLTDLAVDLSSMTDTSVVINGEVRNAVRPGQTFVFAIHVENLGAYPSETIRLLQTLPEYLTFLGASVLPQVDDQTLAWNLNAMTAGSSQKIFVNVRLEKGLPVSMQALTSQVNLFSRNDSDPGNNADQETLQILAAKVTRVADVGLSYDVVADSQIVIEGTQYKASRAGESVNYQLRIVNIGPDSARNIGVFHVLPDSFRSFNFNVDPKSIRGDTLFWNLPDLAPGNTVILDFTAVLVQSFNDYPFLIEGYTWLETKNDPNPDNNQGHSRLYVLEPLSAIHTDLSVLLEALTDSIVTENGVSYPATEPGERFDYQLSLRNLGPKNARQIRIEQSLSSDVEFLSASFAPSSHTDNTLIWNLSSLASGGISRWKVQVRVKKPLQASAEELFSSSILTAVQDTNATNNISNCIVKLLLPAYVEPLDLAVKLKALSTSSRIIEGDTLQAMTAGDSLEYQVSVQNRGPGMAHQGRVWVVLPDSLAATRFSGTEQRGDTLYWSFNDLAPDSQWYAVFETALTPQLPFEPFELETIAQLISDQDTIGTNNRDSEIVYGFLKPDRMTNVSIDLIAHTDSVHFNGTDSVKYVRENEIFSYTLVAQNHGSQESASTLVTLSLPDSLELISVTPNPVYTSNDSVAWNFSSLAALETRYLSIQCSLAPVMPIGENFLWAFASISAENESPAVLDDNQDQALVLNRIEQQDPVIPELRVSEPVVDVMDSITVSVRVPAQVAEWDLWLYLPDGEIRKDFADAFISVTVLPAGVWVEVDPSYVHDHLITEDDQEELIFEIHVTDYYGNQRTDRASVIVMSSDRMFLDRNVYRPDLDSPLGIRFKLARYRKARLDIYDVAGRHVTMLVDDFFDGGWHQYDFDGITAEGKMLGSGVYLVTLQSGEFKSWKKFIVVR
ncbi:hypothetical protein GF406_18015 [candidate division KSB1 bacterium]|nr:hypothetical protein [candidate division KSB1 bacterium]